jgi:polynucleotide 5'-hydroxyl-kinase GRC3/NOL9
MKHIIEKGKTLLVDGPASVSLISGEISVLGAPLQLEETLIVREGKRLPLWVGTKATVELRLGEGASVNEADAGTVPSSWAEAEKELLSLDKPVTVTVIGSVDSGKTSFCTFLVNMAVNEKLRTAVIDADLGQSDVGPPSTVGFNFIAEPVKDLFEIEAQDAFFVGSASPSGAISKIIDGLTFLKAKVMDQGADFVVINTDGWVEGEEASAYKIRLAETLDSSAVVGLRQKNELNQILDALNDIKVVTIESPQLVQPRNREKRKLLRELSYKKYMKGAKMQSFSLGWVKVKNSLLGSGGQMHRKRLETLNNLLQKRSVYSEETVAAILVVLKRNEALTEEQVKAAEDYFGKRIKVILEGDEEGLLVGLKNEENNFLGIGILHEVDYKRKTLKVYTPVNQKPFMLCFGQIKLNKNFREIGLSTVYSKDL